MTLLVDASVWSSALRRDGTQDAKEVFALREALTGAESVVATGLLLEELLQGFNGPMAEKAIIERFGALPINPLHPIALGVGGAADHRRIQRNPKGDTGQFTRSESAPCTWDLAPPPRSNRRSMVRRIGTSATRPVTRRTASRAVRSACMPSIHPGSELALCTGGGMAPHQAHPTVKQQGCVAELTPQAIVFRLAATQANGPSGREAAAWLSGPPRMLNIGKGRIHVWTVHDETVR